MPQAMKKQWQLLEPDPAVVRSLAQRIDCSPLMARLLAIRGIASTDQADLFLNPSLGHLTPPSALSGLERATRRIHQALVNDEKILVFGDYDADGITATALLTSFLKHCGARVGYYIPHRMADGYGMGSGFIARRAVPAGVGLIITADCGTASAEAICTARQAGIDTIVTDHHPATGPPAEAVAVINPTLAGSRVGLAHLAGVGVAFYLAVALRAYLRACGFWQNNPEPNLKRLCDLVAVGTVADVAPLIAENRILTGAGLQQINTEPRPGLAALMRLSGGAGVPVDAETIAFRLAPRLNAAGRLVHARMACQLLLTGDPQKAARLAAALCRLNDRRRSMETQLLGLIEGRLSTRPDLTRGPALVVHGERWHEGLLGIVAARLAQRYHRPTLVISTRNGLGKGSGRSIDGIDLAAALRQCDDLLDRCGGHPLAAGVLLPTANIAAFTERLQAAVTRLGPGGVPEATLKIDAAVSLETITADLMADLERLAPFGQGNPSPVFMDTGVRVHTCRSVGARHRRMTLAPEARPQCQFQAIQFNVNAPVPPTRFEKIAYRPQWNYWNGRKQLQLIVEATLPEVR
jgi:single-stranded-DNA-specific exonuclease